LVRYSFPQIPELKDTLIEDFEESLYSDLFASTSNKDMGNQEYNIHFLKFNHNVSEEYWKFMDDPILWYI
jgi:hypothetical protein